MPKSPWRRIPARSSTAALRATRQPASIASRWAPSPSMPGCCSALGRIHGPGEIEAAVAELVAAGLGQLQPRPDVRATSSDQRRRLADLERRDRARPGAPLALPADARAGHGVPPPPAACCPDDDLAFEMQLDCQARLAAAGFAQYEISAYARPGRQCRHNLNYWRFGDYLGIGAGAHGKATVDGAVIRTESRARRAPISRAAAGRRRSGGRCRRPNCHSSSC